MTSYTATIVTANLRDVDGCDSDAAVDAIYTAAEVAAKRYAGIRHVDLTVERYSPAHDRNSRTVIVSHDGHGLDPEAYLAVDQTAEDIADALDYAMSQAIQDGDW